MSYSRPRTTKRERVPISCTECHRRKKKCNRLSPCKDCNERGIPHLCKYVEPSIPNSLGVAQAARSSVTNRRFITTMQAIPISSESVNQLASLCTANSNPTSFQNEFDSNYSLGVVPDSYSSARSYRLASTFSFSDFNREDFPLGFPTVTSGVLSNQKIRVPGGLSQYSTLPNLADEPMPKELLIHYFIARLGPWLSYLDNTLTPSSIRLGWLPFAISHPPLFYATLLTAAVHLNRRKPLRDPGALTWYKLQTIKHANEVMTQGDVREQTSDEMIIVALVLLYFDPKEEVCTREFGVHLRGIEKMVEVRGGVGVLGMRGIVSNWLGICYGPWSEGWVEGAF